MVQVKWKNFNSNGNSNGIETTTNAKQSLDLSKIPASIIHARHEKTKSSNVWQNRKDNKTYKLLCPRCLKPNSLTVNKCSACAYPLTQYDLIETSPNIFLDLINGVNTGTDVLYRDQQYLVFNDKFPAAKHHIDVIPVTVYKDISVLTGNEVPMLVEMYEKGIEIIKKRDIPYLKGTIEEVLVVGYNYPVSITHLHLHLLLPPFNNDNVSDPKRFYTHEKVISDLQTYGKVQLYDESGIVGEQQGREVQRRTVEIQRMVKPWYEEWKKSEERTGG